MAATCIRQLRWHSICIILLYLSQYSIYNAEASQEGAERHKKSTRRRLQSLKGTDSESPPSSVKIEDVMTTTNNAVYKQNRMERKRMKKLARLQKKRARIELKRANRLKRQYDATLELDDVVGSSQVPPPLGPPPGGQYGPPGMMGPPLPPPPPIIEEGGDEPYSEYKPTFFPTHSTSYYPTYQQTEDGHYEPPDVMGPHPEGGQYGPPDMGPPPPHVMGPPPPHMMGPPLLPPPPPPEYGPPPPLLMGPHLPPPNNGWSSSNYNHKQYGWNGRSSKASKAHHPNEPPPHNLPPHHPPYHPPYKPTFFPTYSTSTSHHPSHQPSTYSPTYQPTQQPDPILKYSRESLRFSIASLMYSTGIDFPTSREEYNALVETLERTIFDTARAPLYIYQKVVEVKIIEIEGITPREDRVKRKEEMNFRRRHLQRRNDDDEEEEEEEGGSRRIRFDIVAEQRLTDDLESAEENSMQAIVDNLYDTITSYLTEQVESGQFTIDLRENAIRCGRLCLSTLADASVTNVAFLPASDILIAIPTPAPTKLVTRPPSPPPQYPPMPTYQPTTLEPTGATGAPTFYPTQSPTLFVSSSCFCFNLYFFLVCDGFQEANIFYCEFCNSSQLVIRQ